MMTAGQKDRWDKADIILKPVGGLLTALAIAILGFMGSKYLEQKQQTETGVRLYAELVSQREQSERSLRKDMFSTIFEQFLKQQGTTVPAKLLNLELLAYNFHESLNLKPLFLDVERQIRQSHIRLTDQGDILRTEQGEARLTEQGQAFLDRLHKVAREMVRKQQATLDLDENTHEIEIEIDEALLAGETTKTIPEFALKLGEKKEYFRVTIEGADSNRKEITLRLQVWDKEKNKREVDTPSFSVGFFDFPQIDNTLLPNDTRFAVVLTEFKQKNAQLTAIYFPGSRAGIKEKPYYQQIIESLLPKGIQKTGL